MKRLLFALVGILVPLLLSAQEEASYIIGESDLLEISVWGEETLSRQVTVRSDGYISMPLAGDLKAAGKTPPQLQSDIEGILAKYVKSPHCAVIVQEPRSKRVYVEGQVNQPGEYIIDRGMVITQIISRAGGFNEWADTDDIVILRNEKGEQIRIKVNYPKIIKGKHENIAVHPGDTIIVP
ncbi:MAG: Polysialic acid transport protein KpsD precursor [Deltaproteobacteria bacterium ADurb.BinA179]|jgi:polysaccharide export outer membrane protein|nr:polysaccharide biosynthesis/export family protein [Deltaproteobacteria bacterium]MDI9542126.1 polysaccharide biosynthesis/export family protein [Pseudomonadota bacterium]NLW66852.1 sugar ABC transporter substrate-binding protein [Bacteriovoracaceae bacterium]OPZ29936.1 MAG: Polysialic acid transport protein KpsD precursor [Deltaproteobacteria bacterium ADurb.BinA179]HRR21378.1 polysaccharide biosynthesis/export family protein [Desulfomonilia bacterium]